MIKKTFNPSDISNIFLVTPPGLEELAEQELQEKWKIFFTTKQVPTTTLKTGGVEVSCSFIDGCMLNPILKIPSKILMRLDEFRCRDFPRLFQKISKYHWSPFLYHHLPSIKSSAIQSRIFDSRKIEKACLDGINTSFKKHPPKHIPKHLIDKYLPPELNLRIEEDLVTISINLSGERLGIRSYHPTHGKAPLRENLAAALVYFLKIQKTLDGETLTLLDPMCGSGTIPLEAAMFYIPNFTRSFAYQFFPLWSKLTLNQKLDELQITPPLFKSIFGSDIDPLMIEIATSTTAKLKTLPAIAWKAEDVFTNPNRPDAKVDVLCLNPPYGIRLTTGEQSPSAFYIKLIHHLIRRFTPQVIGILIPAEYANSLKQEFNCINELLFDHGGLDVTFLVLKGS